MRAMALLVAAAFAGCTVPGLPPDERGPSRWERAVEPSMAPDFTGMGESYPVLLVHQHHLLSKRQQEQRQYVVCLDSRGEEVKPLNPLAEDAAAAPCMGPPADAATGRVHMSRDDFEARDPDALVVLMDPCAGGLLFLDEGLPRLTVRTPAHDFLVERHANRTFSVDGAWIEPGTALKISYFIHPGDEMDEEFVRVVFDHPGEWLASRVGPYDPDVDGGIPRRPDQGTGLVVDAALSPATLAETVRATLAATPGRVLGVREMRMVHDGERLTEVTLRYATDRGAVTWYGAGRTGDSLRLLGAESQPEDSEGAPLEGLLAHFDRPWNELRAGLPADTTDVRLDPATRWTGPAGANLALDPIPGITCREGCVLLHHQDPLRGTAWRALPTPEKTETQDALTLHVLAHHDDTRTSVWWHVAGE